MPNLLIFPKRVNVFHNDFLDFSLAMAEHGKEK